MALPRRVTPSAVIDGCRSEARPRAAGNLPRNLLTSAFVVLAWVLAAGMTAYLLLARPAVVPSAPWISEAGNAPGASNVT
jgi:hypothetical protein